MKYDYLIVGAGFFGSVFAHEAKKSGKKCLVIDKRSHVGGNAYTSEIEGVKVHEYGPHIFHTNNKRVWEYVNSFGVFNNFINSPIAYYKGEVYNLPFNMNTFNKMWGVITPEEAKSEIEKQKSAAGIGEPCNLEEQAIKLVGKDIYEKLIRGYTQKQWGTDPKDLPAFIIRRLPVRFTYNNNYFKDKYQGIPTDGYTSLIENMLVGIDVKLNEDFFSNRDYYESISDKIVFTGLIDEYFEFQFGPLEYRSLRFEHETYDIENYQGNAVVNYTDSDIPFTRIIEHKHFEMNNDCLKTIITKEYSAKWEKGMVPYYPINNDKNSEIFEKYNSLAVENKNVIFGGRLAEYKYYDMDKVIERALNVVQNEFG